MTRKLTAIFAAMLINGLVYAAFFAWFAGLSAHATQVTPTAAKAPATSMAGAAAPCTAMPYYSFAAPCTKLAGG